LISHVRGTGISRGRQGCRGFCQYSGDGHLDLPNDRLVPFGSDRAPFSGSYRVIITSCWNAPGLNRKPPAVVLVAAGGSGPALATGAWTGASERAHTADAPIRECGFLPHVGRDPLLSGLTVSARMSALFGIKRSEAPWPLCSWHCTYHPMARQNPEMEKIRQLSRVAIEKEWVDR
jgi:hypothetical protein